MALRVGVTGMSIGNTRSPAVRDEIDLAGALSALRRRKKVIFAGTAACFLLTLVAVNLVKPRYQAEATVLVENQESFLTRPDNPEMQPDEEAVTSQAQVIRSREIARQAIRKLDLVGNPEFDPLAKGGLLSSLFGARTPRGPREDMLFQEYYERLNAFALPKSRVVSVSFQSQDPDLAARAANTIAELYIEAQANAKREQARRAAQSLESQVEELRKKVVAAETRLEAYRLETGLMVGLNNSTLPSQQLAEINAQLAAARTTQADAQARARLLREALRAGRIGEVPDIANNELVRRMSEQRMTLRSQLGLETRTLGPEHPRAKDLQAQIATVEGELRNLADRVARTLENDARIAGSRVDYLLQAIENQRLLVGSGGDKEVRLRALEREARIAREQFEASSQRWQEALARQTSTSTPADARVISRAVPPEKPAFPKKMPMTAFATIGGLILSVFYVIASEMLGARPGAQSAPRELPRPAPPTSPPGAPTPPRGGRPSLVSRVLGKGGESAPATTTPGLASRRASVARADAPARALVSGEEPGDAQKLTIAAWSQALLEAAGGEPGYRVLVCAEGGPIAAGEGALALSRSLARRSRAVLVDLSGGLRESEGVEGLGDVLDGASTFARALRRDENSRLHILGRGEGAIEPGADLDSVVTALSRTYDFVVLLVSGSDDIDLALALAAGVDHCFVATRGEGESIESLQEALYESGAAAVDPLPVPAFATEGRVRRPARV